MIFWNTLIRFERSKVIPFIAARNTLGVALPLAVGVAIGQPAGGLVASIGAMNVSYSDSQEPYRTRARRMLTATACMSLAVAAGGLLGPRHLILVIVAALAGFAAGMMGAVSQAYADVGVMTLATLIVFAAQSMSPAHALLSGLSAMGGGLLQTGLAVASWPVRRYSPERRALSNFYAALARAAASGPDAFSPDHEPPATAQSTEAQQRLAALNGDASLEAERYLALLTQAERMRIALTAISRLRVRLSREPDGAAEAGILDDAMAAAARALNAVGDVLLPGAVSTMGSAAATEAARIEADGELLRVSGRAMARDARFQLDALAGQIRAAAEIAFHATPAGEVMVAASQAAAPPPLRIGNALARFRANLNFHSDVFRHAVRMALCVALGEAINRVAGTTRGYWLPMTVAIVLRPDFTTTFARGFLRLGGTMAGLVAATGIIHYLHPSAAMEVALIALFVYLMRCFGPANYGIFVTCLTALIVFMISMTGVAPGPVMAARGINTLAGGGIALLTYALWPTWERTVTPQRLAALLDAYRAYFNAVCEDFLRPSPNTQLALNRARLGARLARSNAEASMARLAAEPGDSAETARLQKLMANSHRFVFAVMSLEAGLAQSAPAPIRAGFDTFATAVSRTLEQLAGAFRGKPLDRDSLPDLRELHRELVRSGDARFGRHALINVEADRIANSLNTMAELVGQAAVA